MALCLLALLGLGALAVDLGSAWQSKRDFIIDTDAAALAAAPYVLGTCDQSALNAGEEAARQLLESNLGVGVATSDFDFAVDCNTSAVTVTYVGEATATLSGIITDGPLDVLSASTAAGDFIGGGLRPFSICMDDPEIQAWVEDGDANGDGQGTEDADGVIPDGGTAAWHRLDYEKSWDSGESATVCGGASGNWGFVCYDKNFGTENPCSNDDQYGIQAMVLRGYGGDVSLDGQPDCDPTTGAPDDCDTKTGVMGGSLQTNLSIIACPADTDADDCRFRFPILGMNGYTPTDATGTNAELNPTAFVAVVLRDYKVTGNAGRHLTFELTDLFEDGTASSITSSSLERLRPRLCGVDHAPDNC